ncbi:MAG: hypothetical protein KatS3mg121_1331 [Gammaproteobacteria bacterium]|nr:MAG: hypothetical protein KatS3mg121_1331 [Gammaproteobacteria bacterium]
MSRHPPHPGAAVGREPPPRPARRGAPPLLLVVHDPALRARLARLADREGLCARVLGGADEALAALGGARFLALLVEHAPPRLDGVSLLEEAARRGILPPALLLTEQGDVASAVRAIRAGALDYLEAPFSDSQILRQLRPLRAAQCPDADLRP